MTEVRFHIAGLAVAVRAADPADIADLAPVYRDFPSDAAPSLTIDVERTDTTGERGPEYPGFRRTRLPGDRLGVERFDARGEIDTGDLPLTARFVVGPSPNSLEACVRIAESLALPRAGALIVHASTVVHDGRALVFAGVSGAGKSTVSALLDGAGGARKVGDELVVLRPTTTGWEAYVPPYLGPAGVGHGAAAPLASIDFLVQAPADRRDPVPAAEAVRELLRHVLVYVAEPRTAELVLAAAAALTRAVACHRLHFRKHLGVASVLGIAPDRSTG